MAMQVNELIAQLQAIEAAHGGDLMVITDMEQGIEAAEFNDEGGSPACVLAVESTF